MKTYSLTVKNRLAVFLFVALAVGVGATLLVVGFALIAGLVVAGGVLGTGVAIYRRLTGKHRATLPAQGARDLGLDPALEVFPVPQAIPGKADESR
jgi:hypothetical protein